MSTLWAQSCQKTLASQQVAVGVQEDVLKDGTDCEHHTSGDKQGLDRRKYGQLKHLGFSEIERNASPS